MQLFAAFIFWLTYNYYIKPMLGGVKLKNFIEAKDVKSIENPIILDVRTSLTDDEYGIGEYRKGHVEGAYFLDLEKDLSGEVTKESGNHLLPKLEDFKNALEQTGATNDSTFIIYDAGDNFTAGRMWFLLKYFGLENAFVVNGGLKALEEAGFNLVKEDTIKREGKLDLKENEELLASFDEVKEFSKTKPHDKVLIDSRGHDRYLGKNETLYPKAGHIPGAKSYFFMENYENGKVKNEEELNKRFNEIKNKDIIVSCGSGVTACANFIAMDEIGLKPRLFVGSYSQWIKNGEEISVEEE